MNIKEVLNLPNGTEVKAGNSTFTVVNLYGMKLLHKEGTPRNAFMNASLDVINAEYKLVRKKLNFFEAMRLVDEGKIVESSDEFIYKKDADGCLVCKEKSAQEEFCINVICSVEIIGDWYEVTE